MLVIRDDGARASECHEIMDLECRDLSRPAAAGPCDVVLSSLDCR